MSEVLAIISFLMAIVMSIFALFTKDESWKYYQTCILLLILGHVSNV